MSWSLCLLKLFVALDGAGCHPSKRGKSVPMLAGFVSLLLVCCSFGSYAQAQQTLHKHLPQEVAAGRAALVAAMPSEQQLNFSIVLQLRNPEALTSLLARLYDPASPDYRHFLSVSEFTEQFGPTAADYQAVVTFAQTHGFVITAMPANRLVVPVRGSVDQVEKALHVSMNLYRHPTEDRNYFSPDREPSLNLTVQVAHISGLNNFSIPQPMVKRLGDSAQAATATSAAVITGSGPSGSYLASDMRAAYYGGTALTGVGQAVGLLEFDGYDMTDVTMTFANAGQTFSVPVNNVLLDGATGTSERGDEDESVLDIVQAIGMAPGLSQVRVYIGEGSDDANILNSMASENLVKSIGCSWMWQPDDSTVDDPFFLEFAAQGQSFFVASGDAGAYDASISPFFYPADDVNVTAVGGTHLVTSSAGGLWSSETVWNSPPYGSGGGISQDGFAIPSWQTGLATTANGGSKTLRNVPDVAMEGDFDNYSCAYGFCDTDYAGTSFAAPRWAGFLALVNQQAVQAGKAPKGGIGFLNPALYAIGKGTSYGENFHDVTVGNNSTDGQPVAFNAGVGYDLTTGWGSANGQTLINSLAGNATPGFWIEDSSPTVFLKTGGTASTTIVVSYADGFSGGVTLAVTSALPSGVTAKWGTNPTTGMSVLTFTATAAALSATTNITITGTSGKVTATTTIALEVHPPTFALASAPTYLQIALSSSVTSKIMLTPEFGFTGSATLSVSGLPSGVTAAFSPNPTTGTSTMTLKSTATAVGGTSTITVTATSGSVVASTQIPLVVMAPTFQLFTSGTVNIGQGTTTNAYIQVSPEYGFTGSVSLAVTGLPAGVTGSFAPNPTTGSSALILVASSTAPIGTHTLTLTGTSGSLKVTTTIQLGVFAPTFELSVPSPIQIGQGSSTNLYMYAFPEFGFTGAVTLAVSHLPSGVTAVITPNPTTGSSAQLLLTATSAAPVGTSTVTVTGTSGKLTVTTTFSLQVLTPTFGLYGPGSLTLGQGTTNVFSIGASPLYGFTGEVTMSVTGLPTGVTASFSPNPTIGGATMTLTASSTTALGTYPLTLTGISGSQKVTKSFSLGIFAQNFSLTAQNSTAAIGQGSSVTNLITLNTQYGFAGSVQLVATGLPTGVTASFSPNPTTSSALMTLTATTAAALGAHTVKVTGTSGALSSSATFGLTTYTPTFTLSALPALTVGQGTSITEYTGVNPEYGFTGSVSLAVSGLPTGVTATFSPNPTNGNALMTIAATTAAVAGTTTVTLTGTYGTQKVTTTFPLTVAVPTFQILTQTPISVPQGGSVSTPVQLNPQNGFDSRVGLAIVGLPAGVTATFSPGNIAYSGSTLTFTASSTAALGASKATIQGRAAGQTVQVPITLNVVSPSFELYSYSGVDLGQGSSGTTDININADNGFTGNVKFVVSGLSSGLAATISPNPAIGSTTMTVTATSTAPLATTKLTITGTSGTKSVSIPISVTVHKPGFSLTANSGNALSPGNSVNTYVETNPTYGFLGNVKLALSGLPAGVTGTLSPNPTNGSSYLTLTAASTAKPGTTTVTITGTSGAEVESTTFPLVIALPTFSLQYSQTVGVSQGGTASTYLYIQPENGFTGNVQLSAAGLPAGVTASFSPNPASGDTTLTLKATTTAAPGMYSFTIAGTSGTISQSITSMVTVYPPSFYLSANGGTTITSGGTATTFIYVNSNFAFTGSVTLAVSGLPSGVTGTFSPNPTQNGQSVLTLHAATTAAPGQYTITVVGTYGSQKSATTFALTVATPSFSFGSSFSVNMGRGQSATNSIYPYGQNGFTGSIQYSMTGLPSGVTASFSPNPSATDSAFTLTASASAALGQYTAILKGVSGTQTATAQVSIGVYAPSFTISSYGSFTIGQGGTTASTVYVNPQYGFTGSVTLAISGLPAGVTGTFSPNPTTGYSTLTLTASSTAVLGQIYVTVKGTSGNLTATTLVPIEIDRPVFSLYSGGGVTLGRGTSSVGYAGLSATNGFTGNVSLAISGLPNGVTASFASNPVALNAANGLSAQANITFKAGSGVFAGQYPAILTGTYGTQTVSIPFPVSVFVPSFTLSPYYQVIVGQGKTSAMSVAVNPQYGFTGNVTLAVSGLPAGVTGTFSPNPTTGNSVLTVSASSSAALGQYTAFITGTSGTETVTTPITVGVYVPSFTIVSSYAGITIGQGNTFSDDVYVSPQYGFTGNVTMTVSGLPTGVTGTFSPNPTTGSSVLTLAVSKTAVVGQYSLTITGTSGSMTSTTTVPLVIAQPGFYLDNVIAASIARSGTDQAIISVTGTNGFTGIVSMTISGLPSGVTYSLYFNPVSLSQAFSGGGVVLNLAASSTATLGKSSVTVTATSGTLSTTTTFPLTVTAAAAVAGTPLPIPQDASPNTVQLDLDDRVARATEMAANKN